MHLRQNIRILIFTTLFCLSCSKDAPTAPSPLPGPPPFSGAWTGVVIQTNETVVISVTEIDTKIQGSGLYGAIPLGIVGEEDFPKVQITISSPGYQPATFNGTFTGLTIVSGSFNNSGFINSAITFHKN